MRTKKTVVSVEEDPIYRGQFIWTCKLVEIGTDPYFETTISYDSGSSGTAKSALDIGSFRALDFLSSKEEKEED